MSCTKRVSYDPGHYHFHPCGRPAKGQNAQGEERCGIHLASEKRSEKARVERAAKWERASARGNAEHALIRAALDVVFNEVEVIKAARALRALVESLRANQKQEGA